MKSTLMLLGLFGIGAHTESFAAPVLMISVDGMKPGYVLQADSHGLKVPYLRSLIATGTYADGVVGVWPTVTYPSHTTLVTGVTPAEHGITANLEFDPLHRFQGAWFWYSAQVRTPTLWQAAHARGLVTASVGWPVTVGATGIDYLIPEYWRTEGDTEELDPAERDLIAALTLPTGLLEQMKDVGPYMKGNDTTSHGDEIKAHFAVELIRRHKPRFMTLHLSSLDEAEHAFGVFSTQANHALEAIDSMLAALADAAHRSDPSTVIAVVSDHGFTPIFHEVNLYVPFIESGLMKVLPATTTNPAKITDWQAQPWLADGMAAIMLKDADDAATRQRVATLLQTIAADPKNGVAAVKNRDELKLLGGFPDATFLVVFKPGYYAGESMIGGLVSDVHIKRGDHGFSPESSEMHASFFISGRDIAPHRDLGVIDMKQIAPTIAGLLGVELPTAKAPPLAITR